MYHGIPAKTITITKQVWKFNNAKKQYAFQPKKITKLICKMKNRGGVGPSFATQTAIQFPNPGLRPIQRVGEGISDYDRGFISDRNQEIRVVNVQGSGRENLGSETGDYILLDNT